MKTVLIKHQVRFTLDKTMEYRTSVACSNILAKLTSQAEPESGTAQPQLSYLLKINKLL